MNKIVVFVFWVAWCFPCAVTGQSLSIESDTLVWTVDRMTDIPHDTTIAYHCRFISYPDGKVVWAQPTDEYLTEFTILRALSNWDSVASDGKKEYAVKYFNQRGRMLFERNAGNIEIIIEVNADGINSLPYIFHVQNVRSKP